VTTFEGLLKWSTLVLISIPLAACESTDTNADGGGAYYGAGSSDPWHYGDYDYPPDLIVNPPDDRPNVPVRPTQPIYRPAGPSVTPMPSIPSTPRPALRR
jgi:hypothetical protein